MTISELAKIALDEGRVVKVMKPGVIMGPIELNPPIQALVWLTIEELAADDWYEVTNETK